jgi:hypothetical protein
MAHQDIRFDSTAKTDPEASNQDAEQPSFALELERLLNRHSMENGSNTPDFILAEYLRNCLSAFNQASTHRERWYGTSHRPGERRRR